jgi:hypothetical protein
MRKRGSVGRGRSKTTRDIVRAVVAAGGTVERTASGHLKITGPDGGVAFIALDPHGPRGLTNAHREIERQTGIRLGAPRPSRRPLALD